MRWHFRVMLCAGLAAPVFAARTPVVFFGMPAGQDPLFASYFEQKVYWALSTDSSLTPVSPQLWRPWRGDLPASPAEWRVDQYRRLAQRAGARYFALAFREPFAYATKRVWWKPWNLSVRTFFPLRLQVYAVNADSALFDGTVAYQDSLRQMLPYHTVAADDPVPYDAWQRTLYAGLVGPTVAGLRAAIAGNPPPSAVFDPDPAATAKKAKKAK